MFVLLVFMVTSYLTQNIPLPDEVVLNLSVVDAAGIRNTLTLGFHGHATDGFDTHIGELPVPPIPVENAFDVRLGDRAGMQRMPPTGSYVDLRALRQPSQIDTFILHFRTAQESYPLRFSWPASIRESCDSLTLISGDGQEEDVIDMLSTTEWVVTEASVSSCKIVWWGVK